jgi:hypothetical protein
MSEYVQTKQNFPQLGPQAAVCVGKPSKIEITFIPDFFFIERPKSETWE